MNTWKLASKMGFSSRRLRQICRKHTNEFRTYGKFVKTIDSDKGHGYVYIDNGSDILAVAHLDSVQENRFPFKIKGDRIYSPVLDDRLGAYTVLDLLPQLGIVVDVLLCDLEEVGMTTAADFVTDKQYNWMVEFDRAGGDAVVYQYRDTAWLTALRAAGFKIGYGSFSDISALDATGVCGVNIGVGYANYHSKDAYFDLAVYLDNIAKFATFYNTNRDITFKHDPTIKRYDYSYVYTGKKYAWNDRDYDWDDYYGKRWGEHLATKYGEANVTHSRPALPENTQQYSYFKMKAERRDGSSRMVQYRYDNYAGTLCLYDDTVQPGRWIPELYDDTYSEKDEMPECCDVCHKVLDNIEEDAIAYKDSDGAWFWRCLDCVSDLREMQ